MRNVLLFVILGLAMVGCSKPGPSVTGATLVDFGLTEPTANQDLLHKKAQTSPAHAANTIAWQSVEVPGRLGQIFGIRYHLTGEPRGALISATIVVKHPPITNPQTGKSTTHDQWNSSLPIGGDYFAFWSFDSPWEVVPGKWTFQVTYDSKVLLEKTFEVKAAK